jgi:hypothetical protein
MAYTPDSIWRNRDTFIRGRDEIQEFLTKKWAAEDGYRLRKELFAFTDNKVSGPPRCSTTVAGAPAAMILPPKLPDDRFRERSAECLPSRADEGTYTCRLRCSSGMSGTT